MKKILIFIGFNLILLVGNSFSIDYFNQGDTVYTSDQSDVVSDVDGDSIRSGVSGVAQDVNGIINYEIQDSEDAQYEMLSFVKRVFNYFLMFIATVALVYLLYHGFLLVTAAGNEERYKKGLKGINFAIIAIVLIGVSWMIISLIFWIITNVI